MPAVHLGTPALAVGAAYALVVAGLLWRGLRLSGATGLGPANRVTLVRAALVGVVSALTVESFSGAVPVAPLVTVSAVALALDAVDGWTARRTGSVSPLGARFDMEVDAFLILVLSLYVAPAVGWWVPVIGLWRYSYVAAGWVLPWLQAPVPPRYWRKVVAAVQGVTLAVVAADLLPRWLAQAALGGALALLTESFGRDIWWQWRHRDRSARAVRTPPSVVSTTLALALVWFALLAPHQLGRLSAGAFARLPVEGLALVAVAVLAPPRLGRAFAGLVGLLLGAVTLVKVLDIGFGSALGRPLDLVSDWGYAGGGVDLLADAVGRPAAIGLTVAALVLAVGVLTGTPLAMLRLTRIVRSRRVAWGRALVAVTAVWALCAVTGVRVAGEPVAADDASRYLYDRVRSIPVELRDQREFQEAAAADPLRTVPADRLLGGLRGKDVVLVFVESYGRVAVDGSSISDSVDQTLDSGTQRLRAAGFSARSGFLTSPTYGGISWLAHSTIQSGLWVDSQKRYDALLSTDRTTLSGAFQSAGWRTVGFVPSNVSDWPEGLAFYGFDRFYDARNVGYAGPRFSYSRMPDQFSLAALQRLELGRRERPPVMAEIDLTSSHTPWTPTPELVDWSEVGDGSVFTGMAAAGPKPSEVWPDPERVRSAYAESVRYTLDTLVSYVETYGDDDLVLIVLGDHQPAAIVSGEGADHDVPVSVVAHDPAVLARIADWGWTSGLRPAPDAPLWPMDSFRGRFLAAYEQ